VHLQPRSPRNAECKPAASFASANPQPRSPWNANHKNFSVVPPGIPITKTSASFPRERRAQIPQRRSPENAERPAASFPGERSRHTELRGQPRLGAALCTGRVRSGLAAEADRVGGTLRAPSLTRAGRWRWTGGARSIGSAHIAFTRYGRRRLEALYRRTRLDQCPVD
jgi:hypothetical protein